MKLRRASSGTTGPALIDAVMDMYVIWRELSVAVREAYRAWEVAPAHERARAYNDYEIALDREELAADDYRRVLERAGDVLAVPPA